MFKELRKNINQFLNEIFIFIDALDLDVSGLEIDHVALRYKKDKDVDRLFTELKLQARILSDAIVNGRKIYIFKLNNPLQYKRYKIPCVELPYPAINHDYLNNGWEHVEFVLPTKKIEHFESTFKVKFPHLTKAVLKKYHYKFSIPEVEGEQLPNPTCILTKYKGLSVKFHPNSIEKVVIS